MTILLSICNYYINILLYYYKYIITINYYIITMANTRIASISYISTVNKATIEKNGAFIQIATF